MQDPNFQQKLGRIRANPDLLHIISTSIAEVGTRAFYRVIASNQNGSGFAQ